MKKVFSLVLILTLSQSILNAKPSDSLDDYTFYTNNAPPYSYIKNGENVGIYIEILDAIINNLKLDKSVDAIIFSSWEEAYNKTLDNDNYIVFPIIKNEKREHLFKWSEPILDSYFAFFGNKGSKFNVDQINSYKLAAIASTASIDYLESIGYQKSNLVISRDFYELLRKLYHGEIDFIIEHRDIGVWRIKNFGKSLDSFNIINTMQKGSREKFRFGFSLNTPDSVIEKFNAALKEVLSTEKDGMLFIDYLRAKYLEKEE